MGEQLAEQPGEHYSFRVSYNVPIMRRAIYAFIFHQLGGRALGIAGFLLAGLYAAYLIAFGVDPRFAGFVVGLIVAVLTAIAYIVIAYLARSIGTVKRMKVPEALFTATETDVTIASELATVTMPWPAFTQIYGCEDCWLLLLAPNQFFSLPTQGVPAEALAFIRVKIPKYRSIVGRRDQRAAN